jgi:hypothetical protein
MPARRAPCPWRISAWEAEADDTIPLNGQHRRLRAQLRFWARKGLKALGENGR